MALKTFSGRRASQNEQELNAFADFLKSRGVKRYLEIGARHGDTFHAVMSYLPIGSHGVAVDLPGALWGTNKSRKQLLRAVEDVSKQPHKTARAMFGDSHDAAFAAHVHKQGPFDAVLIDGDHTLAGVTRDWKLYWDVAPIVAFHDIVGNGQSEKVHGNKVEVPQLWQQLKRNYQHVEFVARGSTMGIGVLWK